MVDQDTQTDKYEETLKQIMELHEQQRELMI